MSLRDVNHSEQCSCVPGARRRQGQRSSLKRVIHGLQVHSSLRKQRRLLEKEAVGFARQADRLDGEPGLKQLRRCTGLICRSTSATSPCCHYVIGHQQCMTPDYLFCGSAAMVVRCW